MNPVVTRAAENSRTNRIVGAICPLCPFAISLISYRSVGWLVGAVGIEFAVHLISPADSIALVSRLPPKMQLGGRVLWPRCGLLPSEGEDLDDTLPRRPISKSLRRVDLN